MILKIPFNFPYKSVLDLHLNSTDIAYCIDTQKVNTIRIDIKHHITWSYENGTLPAEPAEPSEVRYISYQTKAEMELAYRFLEANINNG